jgi:DNA-binding GntR family transcriptional regulator
MSTSAKSSGGNGRRRGRSATSAPRARRKLDQAALVEELVQALESGIATGAIPVNSWLRQETLAAEFDVSRTPVREALRVLQARGMVEVVPNRGALVRGPTPREIREAYVLRAELEGFAAQLASDYIRDDELHQLREAEQLFERTVDTFIAEPYDAPARADAGARPTWMQANDLFHQAVQLGAGNSRLKAAIEDLHRSFPRNLTWSALSGDSRLLSDNVKEHAAIRAAIEERDAAAARRLMTDHVLRSGELVVMWFERQADQR